MRPRLDDARLAKLTRDDFLSFMRSDPRVTLEFANCVNSNGCGEPTNVAAPRFAQRKSGGSFASHVRRPRSGPNRGMSGGSWKFIIFSIALFAVWVAAKHDSADPNAIRILFHSSS